MKSTVHLCSKGAASLDSNCMSPRLLLRNSRHDPGSLHSRIYCTFIDTLKLPLLSQINPCDNTKIQRNATTSKTKISNRVSIQQWELTIRHAQHTRKAFRAIEHKLIEGLVVPRDRDGVPWVRSGIQRSRQQLHIPFVAEETLRKAEEILE